MIWPYFPKLSEKWTLRATNRFDVFEHALRIIGYSLTPTKFIQNDIRVWG